jgi:uncharacterized protein
MGWQFYGHASVFGAPDLQGDVFVQGCFRNWLANPAHINIPMLNGHDPNLRIGRWVRMHEDGYGLFVIGELNDGLPPCIGVGLSITPVNSQGSAIPSVWGGSLCRVTDIAEISIVTAPSNLGARIMGAW